jgi:hypothetical protein
VLIVLEDRLGGGQAVLLFHEFIAVGEYGLALEEIGGALGQDKIAITDQERGTCWPCLPGWRWMTLCPTRSGSARRSANQI